MDSFSFMFGYFVAALYVAVSCYYIVLFRSVESKSHNIVRIIAGLTTAAHLAYLITLVIKFGRLPMASAFEALSVTAFFITMMYIIVQFTSGESGIGVFLFPVTAAIQLVSALNIGAVESFNPVLASPFFAIHTLSSIMGYAAFMISMFYSAMYLLMHSQIKSRKFGLFYDKLPSLDALDSLNNRAILFGFPLLTFGLITGVIWAGKAGQEWSEASFTDPKIFISFVLLFLYGISILLRIYRGWGGKRSALLSLLGGAILLFSFFVVSNYVSSVHKFV